MGIIFDTIAELARLNKSQGGPKIRVVEIGGVYYLYDKELNYTEHRSLQEIEGSEEWVPTKVNVIGLSDEPEYQSMTMYYEDPGSASATNKIKDIYPHKVKTASGNIVHLAS